MEAVNVWAFFSDLFVIASLTRHQQGNTLICGTRKASKTTRQKINLIIKPFHRAVHAKAMTYETLPEHFQCPEIQKSWEKIHVFYMLPLLLATFKHQQQICLQSEWSVRSTRGCLLGKRAWSWHARTPHRAGKPKNVLILCLSDYSIKLPVLGVVLLYLTDSE